MQRELRDFLPDSELRQNGGGLASVRVMTVLLLADALFIVLYIISVGLFEIYDIQIHQFLYFNSEYSLASVWGYSKYGFALALFYAVFRDTRNTGYLLLSFILLILLLDDAAELHDRLGLLIGPYLDFGPFTQMDVQDRGEPFVYVLMAVIIFSLLFGAYGPLKKSNRLTFLNFMWAIFMLAFFGAALDVAHGFLSAYTAQSYMRDLVATVVEDGAELIAVTFLVFAGIDRLLVQTMVARH
jgi:hypothetical protein